jgi:hypothetical protein
MAPEMMNQESSDKPLDVYSYAMTLYCLIGGTKTVVFEKRTKPFDTIFALMSAVLAGNRPKRLPAIPEFWWELITHCWDLAPERRLSFDQIITLLDDHPESLLPGTDPDSYSQYREACHAEVVEAMPAATTRQWLRTSHCHQCPETRSPRPRRQREKEGRAARVL